MPESFFEPSFGWVLYSLKNLKYQCHFEVDLRYLCQEHGASLCMVGVVLGSFLEGTDKTGRYRGPWSILLLKHSYNADIRRIRRNISSACDARHGPEELLVYRLVAPP